MTARSERPFSAEELRLLASPAYAELLKNDPVLAQLEAEKGDERAEELLLLAALDVGMLRIGRLPVLPLTPAKWSLLWLCRSPYAAGGMIALADLDLFLWLLAEPDVRKIDAAPHEFPKLAHGYAAATGLTCDEGDAEIRQMIRVAFLPMTMLPEYGRDPAEPPRFDAIWLTRLCGIAARETGMSFPQVCHEMSLGVANACYVNWRAREGRDGDQVRRRPGAEVSGAIAARCHQLAEEFIANSPKSGLRPPRAGSPA